jgi:integrase
MASIKRRPDGKWRARYRDPDGKEHAQHFATRSAAQYWLDVLSGDIVRGEWIDPAAGKVALQVWAKRWLDAVRPTLKPSTVASYESLLRSRIYPRFGGSPLSAVRPSDVQEWLGGMTADGLSASRVRKCAVVLKMVMDAAVRDNLIRTNPVQGVKPPRIERHEAAYFAPDVVDRIADAMPTEEYRLLVRVLGVGGLRFGEAAALQRQHVDLVRRRLLVRESLTEVSGRLVRTATKTYQHRRVPLPPSIAKALSAHLDGLGDAASDAPVFRSPEGGELRYRAFHGRVWSPALERLGLSHVGVHVLRHSAAARMIQAGASPKAVQTVLGHRSAAFTLSVYGHIFDTDLDDLAARLDAPADFSRTEPIRLDRLGRVASG